MIIITFRKISLLNSPYAFHNSLLQNLIPTIKALAVEKVITQLFCDFRTSFQQVCNNNLSDSFWLISGHENVDGLYTPREDSEIPTF